MSVNDQRLEPVPPEDIFKVQLGENNNAYSATFIFGNEDHTLGNTLRHILMQRKETEFCGYSVPHPYEPKMNVRLQSYPKGDNSKTSIETLKLGLQDLEECCNILDEKFSEAVAKFKSNKGKESSKKDKKSK